MTDNQKQSWEESYQKKDNFLFFPHEEVIRFFAGYVSKRVGLDAFEKKASNDFPKVLDLGCGIGRHVVFAHQMKTDAYGIDLSQTAVDVARAWATKEGMKNASEKIVQGDITKMPFENEFFDHIVSHGVLDSMSLENSMNAFKEAARVLSPSGYFYCDLISGDDSDHSADFGGEELVNTEHEKNTLQLYFNDALLEKVIAPYFKFHEKVIVRRTNVTRGQFYSRYHLILKKKSR
jgi:ubiquinone/menaquinone biosynthesis C-methylase UbiE